MFSRNRLPNKKLDRSAARSSDPRQRQGSAQQSSDNEWMIHNGSPDAIQQNLVALTPARVMQLQRTVGNHAATQLAVRNGHSSTLIQRNPVKDKLLEFINNDALGANVRLMAKHILRIIMYLDAKNWGKAYTLLHDRAIAKSLKYRISDAIAIIDPTGKTQAQIDTEAYAAAAKGMHFKGELVLPDVAVQTGYDDPNPITPANDARLARIVLPAALEEWIHMFQNASQSYLSESTYDFEETPEVQANQALPDGKGRWDLKEVDIFAAYRDLGWADVLDAFRSRYRERQQFQVFLNQGGGRRSNMVRGLVSGGHRG